MLKRGGQITDPCKTDIHLKSTNNTWKIWSLKFCLVFKTKKTDGRQSYWYCNLQNNVYFVVGFEETGFYDLSLPTSFI